MMRNVQRSVSSSRPFPLLMAMSASFLMAVRIHGMLLPQAPRIVPSSRGQSTLSMSSTAADSHAGILEDPRSDRVALTHDCSSPPDSRKSEKKRTWADDGFVFGLDGSGIERPKGRVASVVVEGDSLDTKPYQVAMVLTTFVCHAFFAASSLSQMLTANNGNVVDTALEAVLLAIASWILADFGSGVLHWSVDNYGNGRTPIMGGIIAAFQGHHSAPWTIAERGFCNNVYKLCIPFGPLPLGVLSLVVGPFATYFLTVFCMLEILSQEFHKWSHQLKSEVPAWVNVLQDSGLTIARKPHAQHHLAPYDGNYCIISGICNPMLDGTGFFRRLEHIVYMLNGVESNAWKLDAQLKQRTLSGNYSK